MKLLQDSRTGGEPQVKTLVSFRREADVLIYKIKAFDSSLNSYSEIDNDELYRGDVVEVFLDLGDPDFYYEFEVAPNGATFVAKKYHDHLEFIKKDFFFAKSKIEGDDYEVEIRIDLTAFADYQNIKHNVYRIETKGIKSNYILLALEPTLCDNFHVRNKFIDFNHR
ncbi:MAG: hypothetical protein ACOX3K_02130 [Bacilli bacterium]